MKKYLAFVTAMLIQPCFMSGSIATQIFPNATYQTNPLYRMTPAQKNSVQYAFNWALRAFQQNHKVCRNRGECLSLDLQSLTNYIRAYPNYPATIYFKNIYNIIRNDSMHQKFVSEWVIFQNLSAARQADYRSGLRITPIRPQTITNAYGAATPAFFNQDDVFTELLQEVDHYHKNCDQYITCLRGDLAIIDNMDRRLNANDPVRYSLQSLRKIISILATTKPFNDIFYLNLYNPFSPSWYDMSKKYKARKLTAYGYQEWRQIERSSRPVAWGNPRFTNGTSTFQGTSPAVPQAVPPGSFRSYVEGLRSKSQTETAKAKGWGPRLKNIWNDNKDLLKGWW